MLNDIFNLVAQLATNTDPNAHPELGYILIHIFYRVRQLPSPNILNAFLIHLRELTSPTIIMVRFLYN